MDWHEPAAAAGGGVIVACFEWLLGRRESAEARRREAIAAVVRELTDVRLATIETMLPSIATDVTEVKAAVAGVNEKLDRILLSGRLAIRRVTASERG